MSSFVMHASAFALAALVTFFLTPLAGRLAEHLGLVDRPGGRRAHSRPIPRLGGVAVMAGLLVGSSAYGIIFGWDRLAAALARHDLVALITPCALVFLVGLLDDVRGLSPASRLTAEALAGTVLIQAGFVIESVATPWSTPIQLGYFAYPFTLLWIVGVTNAFNLVDGLDGLCTTLGITALVGIAAVSGLEGMRGTPMLALALGGALAGFLPWNWHPARIFLGDSGSLLVGFMTAALTIKISRYHTTGATTLHVPLALCALPILETLLTIARRSISGHGLFTGDRGHIHHVLVERGLSVPRVVLSLGGLSALGAAIAVFSRSWRQTSSLLAIVLIVVLGALIVRWLHYVELRVLGHLARSLLRGGRRRDLGDVVALARAGDLVRAAIGTGSAALLREALGRAATEARVTLLALDLTPAARAALVTGAPAQAGPSDPGAVALLGARPSLGGVPPWVASDPLQGEERATPATPGPPMATVTFEVPLPPTSGALGHLVVHLRRDPSTYGPHASDITRYLAEPISDALSALISPGAGSSGTPAPS